MKEHDEIIKNLQKSNKIFAKENKSLINKFIKGQKPKRGPEGMTFRASWSLLLPLALLGLGAVGL